MNRWNNLRWRFSTRNRWRRSSRGSWSIFLGMFWNNETFPSFAWPQPTPSRAVGPSPPSRRFPFWLRSDLLKYKDFFWIEWKLRTKTRYERVTLLGYWRLHDGRTETWPETCLFGHGVHPVSNLPFADGYPFLFEQDHVVRLDQSFVDSLHNDIVDHPWDQRG